VYDVHLRKKITNKGDLMRYITFKVFTFCLVLGFMFISSSLSAHEPEVPFRYMTNHGTFLLDDHDEDSFHDPRNPKIIISDTDDEPDSQSIFYFIFSVDPNNPDYQRNAENCLYQYKGSLPDTYYFPGSKGSIWDLFKLEPNQADECLPYSYLTVRSPHGEYPEIHMHFRYGDQGFSALLNNTLSDPSSPEAWWSTYESTAKFTPEVPEFSYLNVNGTFIIDTADYDTVADPRNPVKMEFTTTDESHSESRFVFYTHNNDQKVWADCSYQYVGSQPDPYYFPHYKTSIWDLFEMTSQNLANCDDFTYVILRSPHDSPAHAHMRYGSKSSSFEELLNKSLDGDTAWWSTYVEYLPEQEPQVFFPDAQGMILSKGDTVNITWAGFSGSKVKILLYQNNKYKMRITSTRYAENSGSTNWTVPKNLRKGSGYRIRVISLDDSSETAYSSYEFTVE
jgi:hypothetical protein